MKRFVRLLCALLCVSLALGALPVGAAGSVRLKDSSCDFVSGYYVVYDYNGTELRSDLLGPNTNYDLWKQLSTADKKAVLTVFAFGPGWFQEQFGDNTAKMNDWWNDASGWAGAREVLRQRIAAREFPVATACFSGSYQDKSRVELPQVEHPPTEAYCFLPEVKEYYDLCAEMEATWDLGSQALVSLQKTKGFQVGVAVTALSGDLISLICERALVPAITPGGLSALAPSLSGELLSLADKMTGLSDSVIEKAVGKRVDAGTARKIIDECWQIIELNDQYANQCIQHFLSLKGRKADAYQRAADAVSAYIEENGTLGESAAQRAHDLAYVSVSASVPSYTDREELDAAYSAFQTGYNNWYRSVSESASNLGNRLREEVLSPAFHYESWPQGFRQPDSLGPMDLSGFYGYFYAAHYWDGEKNVPTLPTLLEEMPAAFSAARAEAEQDLANLDAYLPDYEALTDRAASEWRTWRARWLGFRAAYRNFEVEVSSPDGSMESFFLSLYASCGCASGDEPLGKTRERMEQYQTNLGEKEDQWNSETAEIVADIQGRFDAWILRQDRFDQVLAETVAAKRRLSELLDGSDAKYYAPDRGDDYGHPMLGDEALREQFEAIAYNDYESYQALYDQCGGELEGFWAEYQTLHDTWRAGVREMMVLEREFKGILGINSYYIDGYSDQLNLMSAIGGRELKSIDEMQHERIYTAGHLSDDGWDMRTVGGTDEDALNLNLNADGLRHSYTEFTGENNIAAEMARFYDDITDYKGKFLRSDEEGRKNLESTINNQILSYVQSGDYGQYNYPYTYRFCYVIGPLGGQKVKETLDGWRTEAQGYKPVTGLSRGATLAADGPEVCLEIGETRSLAKSVTVEPADASDRSLIWTSSNDGVCEVDENGLLTAWQSGTATITVRAADSDFVWKNGEKVYSPTPLSWTVQVGSGEAPVGSVQTDAAVVVSYGTGEAPRPYSLRDNGDGSVTVGCTFRGLTTDCQITVALYSGAGQLLAVRCVAAGEDFAERTVSLTAQTKDGLRLRAFAWDRGKGCAPICEALIDETVA